MQSYGDRNRKGMDKLTHTFKKWGISCLHGKLGIG